MTTVDLLSSKNELVERLRNEDARLFTSPIVSDFIGKNQHQRYNTFMSIESLDQFAKTRLNKLAKKGLRRSVINTNRRDAVHLHRNGRDFVSFCCNDYLGLTHHPAVKQAARDAIQRFGVGAGASRLITGNHELYAILEEKIAALKGAKAACVFGSGYLANTGILPALAGPGDLIVIDELGHASMHMGARASNAQIATFRHNDPDNLTKVLASSRHRLRKCLVVTEGIFSMDGDRAPLDEIASVALDHDAWLMVDDAHGFGVVGAGRGSAFEFQPAPIIPLQMGTLSKAVGVYGAFLCSSAPVVELMKNRARSLIYTTGLPPAILAGAIAAVDIIGTDKKRVAKPHNLAKRFCANLGLGEPESPIVPIILGDDTATMDASLELEKAGYLVTPIRPPTVPQGTSRLRITFTAEHTMAQIEGLVDAISPLISGKILRRNTSEV